MTTVRANLTETGTIIRVVQIAPRGMRLPEAADYVGVSESKFKLMVKDGLMPKSFKSNGVTLWDRHKIDAAFDELSNQDQVESHWDDVHA